MQVFSVRNAHQALPQALKYLQLHGRKRDSRNGPVLVAPESVVTKYSHPTERIVFWPERDYNIAFALYEALWMLAGRNDVEPLKRYVKDFDRYSDNGVTLHGAYGYRWRRSFGFDQLKIIQGRLRRNPDDRRCVLQIWDPPRDLSATDHLKDIPCNDTVTFQRDDDGKLNMTVFCRSNDVIWGAYFANAFHFAVLHEYMAAWIGCPVGTYEQISVNFHAYVSTMQPLEAMVEKALSAPYSGQPNPANPYRDGAVIPVPMLPASGHAFQMESQMMACLTAADNGFSEPLVHPLTSEFVKVAYCVLYAHHMWRTGDGAARFTEALRAFNGVSRHADMATAMKQWIGRRQAAYEAKAVTA